MKQHKWMFVLAVLFAVQVIYAQHGIDFSKSSVILRLQRDIEFLASDEMEGREAGTAGERLAAEFIKGEMKQIGLDPVFGDSYFQHFTFSGSWEWGDENLLRVGRRSFEHGEDFFTFPGSASMVVKAPFVDVGFGLDGIQGLYDYSGITNLEGRIFVMEYHMPAGMEMPAGFSQTDLAAKKVGFAIDRGAVAVLFKNSRADLDDPQANLRVSVETSSIPVVFIYDDLASSLSTRQGREVFLSTSIWRSEYASINVGGYIDNQAPTTVVIGGHYDHLGYGGRSSRSPGVRVIHPGADDNASGIAGMLEAARYLSSSTHTGNNYLFLAFGAEEKGLIGSRYFTNSTAYDINRVNYMFNLDMIGRVTDGRLSLIGTGSSPKWDDLIDRHVPPGLTVRKSPGALGGSDHSSFYLKEVPVLFFFSGIHDDYHRPSDTPDKINYEGAYQVLTMMFGMLRELDQAGRVPFSRASVSDSQRRRSDSPTLGLMPDHGYDGRGLRVQAVVDNRPAHQAGLQDGDVIIRINNMEVLEIQSYMEVLGKLQRGQTIEVVVMRAEEEVTLEVQL